MSWSNFVGKTAGMMIDLLVQKKAGAGQPRYNTQVNLQLYCLRASVVIPEKREFAWVTASLVVELQSD